MPAGCSSLITRLLFRKTSSRTFHGISKRWDANPEVSLAALKEELEVKVPIDRQNACIYRVPLNMRNVQPNAYTPNIISIGPYHHGDQRLQEMEDLKWEFFHRLNLTNGVQLDPVMKAMEDLEQEARNSYWDKAEQISKDKFVRMMLVDGCFILELFRELKQNNFHFARSIKRWMLPTLRLDLIMLENQIPLFVLQKLFELTRRSSEESTTSLEDLALRFFNPLLQREPNSDVQVQLGVIEKRQHFLDLFRLSIVPRYLSKAEETNSGSGGSMDGGSGGDVTDMMMMMRSMTELMEAGFVIEKAANRPPFDVRSEGRWLKIPPLYIDDYKGTLFRNMVAYEQCHLEHECKPYVTSYLFFFDGLINSALDVGLLHHKGILHHSLGSDKEVARLVNGLCKEIARDGGRESYLHKVVSDVNAYYGSSYARIRARLVHHYFRSWVVGISTFGAILVLYLTLIQTGYGFVGDLENLEKPFHYYLVDCLFLPIYHLFSFKKEDEMNSKAKSQQDDSEIRYWMFSI